METEVICDECEQEVDEVCANGLYQGLCWNCEQEIRRVNACFSKDHEYVFGDADSQEG